MPCSTASYWIISSASQNDGAATPTSDTTRITWSGQRSRKIAAVTPKIRASTTATSRPRKVSWRVSGSAVVHRVEHRRLGQHAGAQVAVRQVADEVQVAQRQRIEQAVLVLELVDLLRGRVGALEVGVLRLVVENRITMKTNAMTPSSSGTRMSMRRTSILAMTATVDSSASSPGSCGARRAVGPERVPALRMAIRPAGPSRPTKGQSPPRPGIRCAWPAAG